MRKYELVDKSRHVFTYECIEDRYTVSIELQQKNTLEGYKGIQVMCFEKGLNKDGFNNAIGLRKGDLLQLPFMILHFKCYQLFGTFRIGHEPIA